MTKRQHDFDLRYFLRKYNKYKNTLIGDVCANNPKMLFKMMKVLRKLDTDIETYNRKLKPFYVHNLYMSLTDNVETLENFIRAIDLADIFRIDEPREVKFELYSEYDAVIDKINEINDSLGIEIDDSIIEYDGWIFSEEDC